MIGKFTPLLLCVAAGWALPADGQTFGGTPASEQAKDKTQLRAFGSRVGDREVDPNASITNGNRRLPSRINSRLELRLSRRIDRFIDPQTGNSVTDASTSGDQTQDSGISGGGQGSIFGNGMPDRGTVIGSGLPDQP